MYFPRNWEFGSALLKLENFGGLKSPNHPPRYATVRSHLQAGRNFLKKAGTVYNWQYCYILRGLALHISSTVNVINLKIKGYEIMAEGVDAVDWSVYSTSFYLDYSSECFVEAVAYLACTLGLWMRYKSTNWSLLIGLCNVHKLCSLWDWNWNLCSI
jgi:hypothetical protein